MIQEVAEQLVSINDTISIAVKDLILIRQGTFASSDLKYLWIAIASIVSSVIGASLTLWYKQKEFSNFKENLLLQKDLIQSTKTNNENQIRAELVRLQELRNQYKLDFKKFELDHLKKVLDFADDKNEKVQMIKSLARYLESYNPEIPSYVCDYAEYQQYIVTHIYYELNNIEKGLGKIISENPNVFILIHSDIKKVIGDANYLERQATEMLGFGTIQDDEIIQELFSSLFQLHENLNELLEKMKGDFGDLERIKRDFIKSQLKLNK